MKIRLHRRALNNERLEQIIPDRYYYRKSQDHYFSDFDKKNQGTRYGIVHFYKNRTPHAQSGLRGYLPVFWLRLLIITKKYRQIKAFLRKNRVLAAFVRRNLFWAINFVRLSLLGRPIVVNC